MIPRTVPDRAGPADPRSAGFTMVELMVVIVIIGLAAAAVVLTMPDPGGSLRGEAERFAARAKAARDTAIVESRPVALQIDGTGYEVSRRMRGSWQEVGRYDWSEGTQVETSGTDPGTRFDSTGLAEPLQLILRRGEGQVGIAIGQDGEVHVLR